MGIDLYDVVYRLEQRFNIRIDRDEVTYLMRAGWIDFLVWEKLNGRNPPCPDLWAVYRDVLQAAGHQPQRGFWQRLLSSKQIVEHDEEFLRQLGDRGYSRPPPDLTLAHHVAAWIAFTDRDHVPQKERAWPAPAPAGADAWTRESVREGVKQVLAEALAIEADSITPESWLAEDLGAN